MGTSEIFRRLAAPSYAGWFCLATAPMAWGAADAKARVAPTPWKKERLFMGSLSLGKALQSHAVRVRGVALIVFNQTKKKE